MSPSITLAVRNDPIRDPKSEAIGLSLAKFSRLAKFFLPDLIFARGERRTIRADVTSSCYECSQSY